MRIPTRLRTAVCASCALMLTIGCGKSSEIEKVVVSGTVTREGAPVKKGRITFFPVGTTQGPVSGAEIRDGAYRVDAKGGVPVGTHRVEFHEVEVDTSREALGLPPPMVENNILPAKFNSESTLEFTVEAGGAVRKDWDLDQEFAD